MGTLVTGNELLREVRRQQIAVLVRQSPFLAVTNLANALLICIVVWDAVSIARLAPWLVAVAVMALYPLRTWLKNKAYKGLKPGLGSGSARTLRRATKQAAVAGLIWASAAPAFAPSLDADGALFLALVLTGMCGGGAIVLSAIPMAAIAYSLPIAVAVVTMFIVLGDVLYSALAVMVLIFICTVIYAVRSVLGEAIDNLRERIAQAEEHTLYQERFRDFAEAASDWMWESDSHGSFTYLSEGVAAASSEPICLLLQGKPTAGAFVPDTTRYQTLVDDIAQQRQFRDFVYRLRDADGTEHFVSASGRPQRADDGTFLGYRGTAADITERIVRARQLEQAQKELSVMVKETETAFNELERQHRSMEEANQELARARDEALLANQSKSSFLANMSHELRTPLNAIIGFSQLIADEALGPLDDSALKITYKEYAGDVLTSGRHLLDIINDILDLSRLEVGKLELKEQTCPIDEIVGTATRLMHERARSNGLVLEFDTSEVTGMSLCADATKLKQILINLLSNSVKFTPRDGSVRLSVHRTDDGGVVFDVTDTGIGMTAEELAQATQPFVQGDSIYHKRFSGAGLGLSIAKALTELHDGKLHIASAPDHGTTSYVTFPPERVIAAADGDSLSADRTAHAAATGRAAE